MKNELTAERIKEAIHELSIGEWYDLINNSESGNPALDRLDEAIDTALAALREKQEEN